jgi:hypothetical protein
MISWRKITNWWKVENIISWQKNSKLTKTFIKNAIAKKLKKYDKLAKNSKFTKNWFKKLINFRQSKNILNWYFPKIFQFSLASLWLDNFNISIQMFFGQNHPNLISILYLIFKAIIWGIIKKNKLFKVTFNSVKIFLIRQLFTLHCKLTNFFLDFTYV